MEIALMRYFKFNHNLVVHGVCDWSFIVGFESDLVVLTKSGYASGVEIKVTKSDLKNDLKKKHIKSIDNPKMFERYFGTLKHFYYAVPTKLKEAALEQIPSFSGLITVEKDEMYGFRCKVVREPKILFKHKWTDAKRYDLARLGAMRIFGLKKKILKLSK